MEEANALGQITEEKEEWKSLPDHYDAVDGYKVSNFGHFSRHDEKRTVDKRGLVIFSTNQKKQRQKAISLLVAECFLPNPNKWTHVLFRDKDVHNARATNLYWSENSSKWIAPDDYTTKSTSRGSQLLVNLEKVVGVYESKRDQAWISDLTKDGQLKNRNYFYFSEYSSKEEAYEAAVKDRRNAEKKFGVKPRKKQTEKGKKRKRVREDKYGNVLPDRLHYVNGVYEYYYVQMHRNEKDEKFYVNGIVSHEEAFRRAKRYLEKRLLSFDYNQAKTLDASDGPRLDPEYIDLKTAYRHWKQSVVASGHLVSMSSNEWVTLVLYTNCAYCGHMPNKSRLNTLDRVDSSNLMYSSSLAVSSCLFCNLAKSSNTVASFLGHVRLIMLHNKYRIIAPPPVTSVDMIDEIFNPEIKSRCKSIKPIDDVALEKRWKNFVRSRQYFVFITYETYCKIVKQVCYLCGRSPDKVTIEVDRFDSSVESYQEENSRPCCASCNFLKNAFKHQDVLQKCERIMEHNHFKLEL